MVSPARRRSSPPEPRANPTAAVDRTADQAAIGDAIRGFVAALGRRDADRVVPLLPAEVREAWRGLLGSRAVTDFSASLESVGDARFSGDAATADVVVGVSFRTNNRVERQTLRYTGTLERGPSEWRLVSLRQTGG